MANASVYQAVVGAPSTITQVIPAGSAVLAIDGSNHAFTKDSASNLWIPAYMTASRAASAAINTTETVITQAAVIPVGLLQVGTAIRIRGSGICTATVANLSTFTLRAGTLGTTGDQSIVTATVTSPNSGAAIPFDFEFIVAIDAVGAAGTCKGHFRLNNGGTTGISTVVYNRVSLSGTNLATTTATNVQLTYKSAATTTTTTFDAALTTEIMAA